MPRWRLLALLLALPAAAHAAITTQGVIRITDTTAAVHWVQVPDGTGLVEWGTTTAYGQQQASAQAVSDDHVVTLTGLTPGTTYHVRVTAGGVVGAPLTFTTAPRVVSTAITVQVTEPATNADGTPLADLAELRPYYRIDGGPEQSAPAWPATSPTGGRTVQHAFAVPVDRGTIEVRIAAADFSGNESAKSAPATKVLGAAAGVPGKAPVPNVQVITE